ncbi:MAG: hypothetical protein JRF52_00435 [Deltaproteobacteria bacterium]|nr:hypothetical protein [Deltaproteobacteria bacterium]
MDWDDEYDNMDYSPHREEATSDKGPEGRLDPMNIANPVSAYLFLNDDVQDEITGSDRKKMKCLSCGHTFRGKFCDSGPECFSSDTEDVTDEKDHGYS